jgi:hypothetical protein
MPTHDGVYVGAASVDVGAVATRINGEDAIIRALSALPIEQLREIAKRFGIDLDALDAEEDLRKSAGIADGLAKWLSEPTEPKTLGAGASTLGERILRMHGRAAPEREHPADDIAKMIGVMDPSNAAAILKASS